MNNLRLHGEGVESQLPQAGANAGHLRERKKLTFRSLKLTFLSSEHSVFRLAPLQHRLFAPELN